MPELGRIYVGDCLEIMRGWPDGFVQTCVTSPPYWGLRNYGVIGQLGLEKTPQEYVENMVAVFREVRRILRDDGTCWLNLGDSYVSVPGSQTQGDNGLLADRAIVKARAQVRDGKARSGMGAPNRPPSVDGLRPKNIVGIPWRVAFALQADGWYLRQDIIWSKPNPMPESVTDRCTKAHEYIFLLAKSGRYFYDAEAIKEKMAVEPHSRNNKLDESRNDHDQMDKIWGADGMRNKRSVWTVTTKPFSEAHFATFPEDLIAPCILAGSPKGGTVFDPFMGAGTTALVAAKYDRQFIGTELNAEYVQIAEARIAAELAQGKFL